MSQRRRVIPSLVLLTVLALGGAGCAAVSPMGGGAADQAAPEVGSSAAQGSVPEQAGEDAADSAVVITGSITITVEAPLDAAEQATTIVTDAGGRVDARREYAAGPSSTAHAVLTLRVPADDVEDVRASLAELGHVEETSLESTDVSATKRDLDARIKTLRATIARYTEWLGTANDTSDLIELETEISSRQSELESLEAEQRALDDQISMSTITLTLGEEYVAPPAQPEDFGSALVAGWTAFVGFWTQLALGVAVGLPWLVLLAAIAMVIVLLVRRAGRRRREQVVPEQTLLLPQHPVDAAPAPGPAQPSPTEQASGLEERPDVVGGQ